MSRTWANGGPPFLNADNLNALEADVTTALGIPDAALAARVVTGATATALNATYAPVTTTIPKWVTATAYTAGQLVVSPNGDVVSAIASHTSGGSFNPANWNLSPTYAAALPTAAVAYNAAGQVTSVTENGITETYTRDSQGRVATITRNAVTKTITRDSAGRVTGIA